MGPWQSEGKTESKHVILQNQTTVISHQPCVTPSWIYFLFRPLFSCAFDQQSDKCHKQVLRVKVPQLADKDCVTLHFQLVLEHLNRHICVAAVVSGFVEE